jgi:hypothetical protein
MAEIGQAIIGIKTVPLTNKVLVDQDLFNRLRSLLGEINEDSELLTHALELRQLARRIVEEAEIP